MEGRRTLDIVGIAQAQSFHAEPNRRRCVAKRYNYHEVEPKMHEEPFGKGLIVPDDFWRFQKGQGYPADMPLRELVGFSEKTLWCTCTTERFAMQHADLELFALRKHLEGSAEWSHNLQRLGLDAS